jgi:thiosulfate reductase cytochrome b subunit
MGILKPITQWATDPWGQNVPIHIAWFLIWVAAMAGLAFLIVHAIYVRYFAKAEVFEGDVPRTLENTLPNRIPRHYHWIAGAVLTASVIFHVIHASFWLDFWPIWPDKADLRDAVRRVRRFMGLPAPPPRRFAKYPLENKLYHGAIIATGLSAIVTCVFMMSRVRTIFFPRSPYVFGDMTWGLMYVLHGLAGVGLIALVTMHVYFAVRPEKLDITKSMIFGSMRREFYLEHYDPERWPSEFAATGIGAHQRWQASLKISVLLIFALPLLPWPARTQSLTPGQETLRTNSLGDEDTHGQALAPAACAAARHYVCRARASTSS